MSGRRIAAMAMAVLLAGCASKPEPAPRPAPAVASAPPPEAPPPPPPPPAVDDWRDLPLTPGEWSYADGEARYAGFSLRCDSAGRRIALSREGASGSLRVRTTYGERRVAPDSALPAADALLDEMAFSRGRFTIEADGLAMLVIPAWPEPARVVEDCRG